MAIETRPFDVAEYLDNPEMIAAYLEAAFEERDPAFIRSALNDVARAMGMTAVQEKTGIKRETLYKALGEDGNPTLDTLTRVLEAFGVRLSVAA